jgi:hypothetical protein
MAVDRDVCFGECWDIDADMIPPPRATYQKRPRGCGRTRRVTEWRQPNQTSAEKQLTYLTTVDNLTPDPHNRRRHTPRNLEMIGAALRDVGAARSIVIDEHNEVLAGNGVLEAAPGAGISKVQIVDVEGDTIIAVRRSGLTATQKRALAIYDNRAAELAEWNTDQLDSDEKAGRPVHSGRRRNWSPRVERGDRRRASIAADPGDDAATVTVAETSRPSRVR